MRDVRSIIGKVNSNIKTRSRKGYVAISGTAAKLRSKTRNLAKRLRLLSTGNKNR